MKTPIIISIAIIAIITALALGWAVFVKPKLGEPIKAPEVNNNTADTTPAPDNTSVTTPNDNSETWEISVPATEINLQSSLEKSNIIIATKNKKHVTVYKKELENDSLKVLLEFDESLSYDNSGNYWSGLPPSVALSPNKKLIAFADENGPKIYNIENKKIISLAEKIADNNKSNSNFTDEMPLEWSNPGITYVYNFHAPEWSFDNKHISFKQSLYEGSSIGIFNVETKQYSKLEGFFGNNIKWSPAKNLIIAGGESDGYDSPGLYSSESISSFSKLEKKNIFDDRKFNLMEMAFSRNGENIALIYNNFNVSGPGDNSYMLSYTDNNFEKIDAVSDDISTKKTFPLFSADSNSVYYIENKKTLIRYDLQNRKKIEVAIFPSEINFQNNPVWTNEGYLSIIIGSRHMILDLEKHKIIYASSEINNPITFAGFLK